jgi:hypothetical protein
MKYFSPGNPAQCDKVHEHKTRDDFVKYHTFIFTAANRSAKPLKFRAFYDGLFRDMSGVTGPIPVAPVMPLQRLGPEDWRPSMRVKQVFSEVRLVIADIEVNHEGKLRSSPTLCALVEGGEKSGQVIPLNTPDGRPILMKWDNAIADSK